MRLEILPALQGAGKGHIVGVLKLRAEGEAPGEAGQLDAQG